MGDKLHGREEYILEHKEGNTHIKAPWMEAKWNRQLTLEELFIVLHPELFNYKCENCGSLHYTVKNDEVVCSACCKSAEYWKD